MTTMDRYQLVTETHRLEAPVELPPRARGVTLMPAEQPGMLTVAYLSPTHRFNPNSGRSDRIDIDKH